MIEKRCKADFESTNPCCWYAKYVFDVIQKVRQLSSYRHSLNTLAMVEIKEMDP